MYEDSKRIRKPEKTFKNLLKKYEMFTSRHVSYFFKCNEASKLQPSKPKTGLTLDHLWKQIKSNRLE